MIQRIQSVYLLLAALVLSVTYFFPIATFIGETHSLVLNIYSVTDLVPDSTLPLSPYFVLPLFSIVSLVVFLSLISIFLFNSRRVQLMLVRFMLLLLLTYIGLFFFYYVDVLSNLSGGIPKYNYALSVISTPIKIPLIGFIIPLLSAIFLFLASRGIINDEKLIRSADRLR